MSGATGATLYRDDPRYDHRRACVIFNASHGMSLSHLRTEFWRPCRLWPGRGWPVDIFEASLDVRHPLTVYWRGRLWQPDRHANETDLGSIPPPLRASYPHTLTPAVFYLHDRAFVEGCLYSVACPVSPFDGVLPEFMLTTFGPFARTPVEWREVQALFLAALHAYGVNRALAWRIHAATQAFSGPIWRRYRRVDRVPV